jgi:hypothetical protein
VDKQTQYEFPNSDLHDLMSNEESVQPKQVEMKVPEKQKSFKIEVF